MGKRKSVWQRNKRRYSQRSNKPAPAPRPKDRVMYTTGEEAKVQVSPELVEGWAKHIHQSAAKGLSILFVAGLFKVRRDEAQAWIDSVGGDPALDVRVAFKMIPEGWRPSIHEQPWTRRLNSTFCSCTLFHTRRSLRVTRVAHGRALAIIAAAAAALRLTGSRAEPGELGG